MIRGCGSLHRSRKGDSGVPSHSTTTAGGCHQSRWTQCSAWGERFRPKARARINLTFATMWTKTRPIFDRCLTPFNAAGYRVKRINQRSNPHCGASAQSLQEWPRLCRVTVIGTWLWPLCAGATKAMSESLGFNYDSRPCGLHKSRQNLNLARGERLQPGTR